MGNGQRGREKKRSRLWQWLTRVGLESEEQEMFGNMIVVKHEEQLKGRFEIESSHSSEEFMWVSIKKWCSSMDLTGLDKLDCVYHSFQSYKSEWEKQLVAAKDWVYCLHHDVVYFMALGKRNIESVVDQSQESGKWLRLHVAGCTFAPDGHCCHDSTPTCLYTCKACRAQVC